MNFNKFVVAGTTAVLLAFNAQANQLENTNIQNNNTEVAQQKLQEAGTFLKGLWGKTTETTAHIARKTTEVTHDAVRNTTQAVGKGMQNAGQTMQKYANHDPSLVEVKDLSTEDVSYADKISSKQKAGDNMKKVRNSMESKTNQHDRVGNNLF